MKQFYSPLGKGLKLPLFVNFSLLRSVMVMLLIAGSFFATAQTNDYPWASGPCSGGDPYLFVRKNCTSWVAWKINQNQDGNPTVAPHAFNNYMFGSTGSNCSPTTANQKIGNACRWDNVLQNNGYFVTSTPTPGAIAQWNENEIGGSTSVGHVAYVESVSASGIPVLSHYNYNPLCDYRKTTNLNAPRYIRFNRFQLIGTPTIQPIVQGGAFNMTTSIKNNHTTSVTIKIRAALYNSNNQFVGTLQEKTETFTAGQTKSLTFSKSSITSAAGSYKVWIETRVSTSTPFTLVHKYQASSTQPVTIQSSSTPTITVSPTSLTFTSSASSKTATVSGVTSYTVSDNASFISVSKNGSTVTVSVTNNTSSSTRTGTVTITATGATSKTISITQSGASSASVPLNDNPSGATTLTASGSCNNTSANNTNATTTTSVSQPTSCTLGSGKDIWFKVRVPSSGILTIRTSAGSLNNAIMAVYSATSSSGSSLNGLACENNNNNGNGSLMPVLTVYRPANSWVFIRVWGYGTSTGTFSICALNYATINRIVPNDNGEVIPQNEELQPIDDINSEVYSEVSISPNPASDKITMNIPQVEDLSDLSLTIYSALGTVIHQQKINHHQEVIDISEWESGIYYARIKGKKGEKTLKFMVY